MAPDKLKRQAEISGVAAFPAKKQNEYKRIKIRENVSCSKESGSKLQNYTCCQLKTVFRIKLRMQHLRHIDPGREAGKQPNAVLVSPVDE